MWGKGFGYPFSPQIEWYYNIGTAINVGDAVEWAPASTYSMEYPEPDATSGRRQLANQAARGSTHQAVPVIRQCAGVSDHNGICGVAGQDIAASAWGEVVIAGKCDVRIRGSNVVVQGEGLIPSAGMWDKQTASVAAALTAIHAMALEATITSGTCASALISAFLPRSLAGQDVTCGLSTA